MTEFKTIARVGAIPPGEGRSFEYNGRMVAVFFVDGEYLAVDDFCPHMGASLAPGQVEDKKVMCPWHAWCFQLSDGAWVSNPKIKLDTFQVRIVGDEIQVAGPNPAVADSNGQNSAGENSSESKSSAARSEASSPDSIDTSGSDSRSDGQQSQS